MSAAPHDTPDTAPRPTPHSALGGKVVVITGSTRGIGRAIAEACAAEGATVVVSSRTDSAVAETVTDLASRDLRCCGMTADVSSAQEIECLFETTVDLVGDIDAWVNNAGISLGYRPFDECSAEELDRIVDINLTGTMHACRLLIPYFAQRGGVLLNMVGRGYRGDATPFTAAYAATKAAIASLTRSLAAENVKAPVSIHGLVPGMVATDFYEDIDVSPRLEAAKDNWRYALDAFGVPLGEVGARTAQILAQEPGRKTGTIYSLLTPARTMRGIGLMMWHRARGRLGPEV